VINILTEHVMDDQILDDQILDDHFWLRTLSITEVVWTAEKLQNFSDSKYRLKYYGLRLQQMGIHFTLLLKLNGRPEK
jgi:hypothetical protein